MNRWAHHIKYQKIEINAIEFCETIKIQKVSNIPQTHPPENSEQWSVKIDRTTAELNYR